VIRIEAIEARTALYLALAVIALIVLAKAYRFFKKLVRGISNGVRIEFRPESRIMRDEYYTTTTSTANIRQYAPPPVRVDTHPPAIPARRADRREYPQGQYEAPKQLQGPRVTVEPQGGHDDYAYDDYEHEPHKTKARRW